MWEFGGYKGSGNVDGLINQSSGVAAVCGNARGVFEELNQVLSNGPATVFGVNDAGMYLRQLDHWVSLHEQKLELWKPIRMKSDMAINKNFKTHSRKPWGEIDYFWEIYPVMMSLSGYFAMQLAYLMGFQRIILCGCPGDETLRFFESSNTHRNPSWHYNEKSRLKEVTDQMERKPGFKERVRSMSGWTKEYFGGV